MAVPKVVLVSLAGLVVISILAPTHILLLSEIPLTILPDFSVGGVRLDTADVVLGLVILAMIRRGEIHRLIGKGKIPYFKTWFLLGLLISVSYLTADITQRTLTDPLRAAYQVYRYCWKELLYFPLAVALIDNKKAARSVVTAVLLTGTLLAASATWEGYHSEGWGAWGPFRTKNALGAALLAPLAMSLVGSVIPGSRRLFAVSAITVILIYRAVLFTGSRGSFASVAVVTLFCVSALWISRPVIRGRLLRLLPAGLVALAAVVFLKPDVLDRPAVQRALTVFEGTEAQNMQWRMMERWPHFWQRAKQRPWLGYSTPVDTSLGESGNTPHNGFLALAVAHGIPAALLFGLFAYRAVRDGLLVFNWSADPQYALLGLAVACFVAGLLVNSILESTIRLEIIGKVFWFLTGVAAIGAQRLREGRDIGAEESVPIPGEPMAAATG